MLDEIKIIKVTKKKKNYIIETNDKEYLFDEDTLIEFGIFKDRVFPKSVFDEIIIKREANKAFNHALTYLGIGMKSISEMRKYLERKAYDILTIDNTIKRLIDIGYLNDLDYGKQLLSYYRSNNKGPQYISNKLYEKKVERKIIDKVLNDYDEVSEIEDISRIIAANVSRFREYPIIKQRQLISDKLIRNGFTPILVFSIIKEYELIDESDNKLLIDLEKQYRLLEKKDLTDSQKKQKIIQSLMNKGYDYHKISSLLE